MASVCVVGLPKQLRGKLEAMCRRDHIALVSILAGKGKEGTLWLLPHPREAKSLLHTYVDALPDYSAGRIVVLPYVSIPKDLSDEIEVLMGSGADVFHVQPGTDAWPVLKSDCEFDERFRDDLYCALTGLLSACAIPRELPSVYFTQVGARSPNLLIATTVLRRCDTVSEDRYQFMRDAADAFELLLQGDPGIPLEKFFAAREIEHAQSGGITAKVTLTKGGQEVYSHSTQTHLKRGDATTRASAARIYYHRFTHAEKILITILYAGPHPDHDVHAVFQFE